MPLYLFTNDKTNETREVFFSMNDAKVYNGEDGKEKGLWKRVFTIPQGARDTRIDPNNANQFIRSLDNKNGETVGSMWDRSAELSEKRAEKNGGTDPIKQRHFDKYRKMSKGKTHPMEAKAKTEKAQAEFATTLKKLLKED